jgi:predicted DNA-binding transcriptional regulator YafY
MPTTKEAFLRYRIINECLLNRQKTFPSREELKEVIMDRLGLSSFSDRAFEKDLYDMRNDEELGFLAPIKYSARDRGYHYTEVDYSIDKIPLSVDELASIQMASQVFEQYKNIPFLSQVRGDISKLSDLIAATKVVKKEVKANIIQFEEQQVTKGGQFLGELYKAIQDNQFVKIDYHKFDRSKSKKYTVAPYLLKEYQGMWYLVSKLEDNEYRTFALDRIKKLKLKEDYFAKEEDDKVNVFFKNVIGVSYSESKPVNIRLKVFDVLRNYIEVNPIHHSQKTIKLGENDIEVELYVVPNHEFYAKLAHYLPYIKVIEPKPVLKKFSKMLKEASKLQG